MQVSDALGISNSGTKNQAYGSNNFNSQQQLTPEQTRALEYMWNMARGMMDATSHQYQSLMPGINAKQNEIYEMSKPTWQRMMNGGAYDRLNQNKVYDSIYGAIDNNNGDLQQFMNMQNRQRGNLYQSTRHQAHNMNRMSNRDLRQSNRASNRDVRRSNKQKFF